MSVLAFYYSVFYISWFSHFSFYSSFVSRLFSFSLSGLLFKFSVYFVVINFWLASSFELLPCNYSFSWVFSPSKSYILFPCSYSYSECCYWGFFPCPSILLSNYLVYSLSLLIASPLILSFLIPFNLLIAWFYDFWDLLSKGYEWTLLFFDTMFFNT